MTRQAVCELCRSVAGERKDQKKRKKRTKQPVQLGNWMVAEIKRTTEVAEDVARHCPQILQRQEKSRADTK